MKISPERAEAFCGKPDAKVRVVLVYGPDEGMVRERSVRLMKSVLDDLNDPFRVAELAGTQLKSDPALLSDEAAAQALTGGRRVIRVRDADDSIAPSVTALLETGKGDALIVLQAGDLAARSSLRKVVEAAAEAAAVPCYLDEGASIAGVIRETLTQAGYAVERDALDYLVAHLGGDRAVTRSEVEKLLTYLGAGVPGVTPSPVTLDDVLACVGDMSALSMDDMVLAIAEGDDTTAQRLLDRLLAEGQSGIRLLRMVATHFMRLHLVVGATTQGRGSEEALRLLKPPLFWKVRERFLGQSRRWSSVRLGQALDLLLQAEIECKTTGMPEAEIVSRTFLQLCRAARAR